MAIIEQEALPPDDVVGGPPGESGAGPFDRLRRSRWMAPLVVVVMLAAATVYHTYPAATSCSTKVLGPAGDNTAGGVWTAWMMPQEGGNPVRPHTNLTATGEGEGFWQVEWWSQSALLLPMWALSPVTNEVCAYNVVVIGGMFLSAVAMALLAHWLSKSWAVAGLCGYAYGFSPFAQIKAGGHAAYVNVWIFPLQLLAALWFLERPSWRRGLLVGLSLGAAAYVDGYFLLFSTVNAVVLGIGTLVLAAIRWRRGVVGAWRSHLGGIVAAGATMLVVLSPIALAYASQSASGGVTSRTTADLGAYSAEPLDYLLPNRFQPLFNDVFGSLQDRHLGLSNYSESTLSLRWLAIAFGVYAVVLVASRSIRGRPPLPRGWKVAVGFLLPVCLVAAVSSGPPHVGVLGVELPNFSDLVSHVSSAWRVYSRFFIDVHAALLGLAAIGLAAVFWRIRARVARVALFVVLLGVLAFEGLMGQPFQWAWFDYAAAPQGYRWIAQQDDVTAIADWPVWPVALQPDGAFATYQPVHGKAVINGKRMPKDQSVIAENVMGLADPQTLPLLRREGVSLVAVHRELANWPLPDGAPPGLVLARSFTFDEERDVLTADQFRRIQGMQAWYDMDVYRVPEGRTAKAVLLPATGFDPASPAGWTTVSQTKDLVATLNVVSFEDVGPGMASFSVASGFGHPLFEVRQAGRVLWSQRIPLGGSVVTVTVDPAAGPVELRTTPVDPEDSGIVQLSQISTSW